MLYTATHFHKEGTTVYIIISDHYPSQIEVIESCEIDFEEETEDLEICPQTSVSVLYDCSQKDENGKSASRAESAIRLVTELKQNEEIDFDSAKDLIADILHLSDREEWDTDSLIEYSESDYQSERRK